MIAEHPRFEASVAREGGLWVIVIEGPFPPGAIPVTDTPRFGEVETEGRDLIADLTGLAEDEFEVSWRYQVDGRDVTAAIVDLELAEREFARRAAERDEAREEALTTFMRAGLSQRVMSEMVSLSQQRVQQILRARGPKRSCSAS